MTQDATRLFFDAAIDLLVANGNCIYGAQRWRWDKEGGHCTLCRPIDFALLQRELSFPVDVTCDTRNQCIATLEEYLELSHILPHGDTPPFEDGSEPPRYSWSPFWLVSHKPFDDNAANAVFDYAHRHMSTRLLRHSQPIGNRYVAEYWSSLAGAVLEFGLDSIPQQPIWLSRWRFYTYGRDSRFNSVVQIILPSVRSEQPTLQSALLPIVQRLATASELALWNHQEQVLMS
jgi:hypothetical protein